MEAKRKREKERKETPEDRMAYLGVGFAKIVASHLGCNPTRSIQSGGLQPGFDL